VSDRPKNILFLWTDQQRPDTIGAYRGAGMSGPRTPSLDRLAATGVLFEYAYCTQPVCSPARASVLTGLYPHTHGVLENNIPLSSDVPTLAALLRRTGYACGYIGKWHLGREHVPQHGFEDFWVSTEEYGHGYDDGDPAAQSASSYHHFLLSRGYTPSDPGRHGLRFSRPTAARLPETVGKPAFQAAECVRFLETYRDQPFLLMCNFLEPHPPNMGPFDGMYDPAAVPLPESWDREPEETVPLRYRLRRHPAIPEYTRLSTNDERGWQEYTARYWGLCSLVDKYTGQILQRLEELRLAEDTIVVFSTDHGDMMGEHRLLNKAYQYEGAVRVPLLIHVPGLPARRLQTPVSQVSLVPTLLDLLGRPRPGHLQGDSLVSLLAHGDRAPDEAEVFVEWNGEWDYLKELFRRGVLPGLDEHDPRLATVEVRTVRRGRWKLNVHASGEHELYDLEADPGELHNAFYDHGSASVVAELYERLRDWQRQTNDTLLLPDPH
jgi:arylsulfatase A-like enzyme